MKMETKNFIKTTGKNTLAQIVATVVGSAVLGGAKFLGGKIGSTFSKKPLAVDNVDIPVTEETVSMSEVTSENVEVEVTDV
jgi:hypothetical protein